MSDTSTNLLEQYDWGSPFENIDIHDTDSQATLFLPARESLILALSPLPELECEVTLRSEWPLPEKLTREERQEKIKKYLAKKRRRKWGEINYICRKKVADNRVRVKGRFISKA